MIDGGSPLVDFDFGCGVIVMGVKLQVPAHIYASVVARQPS